MPGQNGIALGLELRKPDAKGVLIYPTSSPDYAVDSYLTGAFYYLLKPVKREPLFSVLDKALKAAAGPGSDREDQGGPPAAGHSGHSIRRALRRIRCVLSDGSAVQGTTLRGAFRDAAAPLLEHRQFVLCAASLAVNLACVETAERDRVGLKGGRRLPLSRSFRDEVIARWMDYHLEGGLPGAGRAGLPPPLTRGRHPPYRTPAICLNCGGIFLPVAAHNVPRGLRATKGHTKPGVFFQKRKWPGDPGPPFDEIPKFS